MSVLIYDPMGVYIQCTVEQTLEAGIANKAGVLQVNCYLKVASTEDIPLLPLR